MKVIRTDRDKNEDKQNDERKRVRRMKYRFKDKVYKTKAKAIEAFLQTPYVERVMLLFRCYEWLTDIHGNDDAQFFRVLDACMRCREDRVVEDVYWTLETIAVEGPEGFGVVQ